MWFKILLLWFTFMVFSNIKSYFKTKTVQDEWSEIKQSISPNVFMTIYILFSSVVSIFFIILYVNTYSMSELIGWLSILQIMLSVISYFKGIFYMAKIINENSGYNKYSLYNIGNTLLDIVYLILVWKVVLGL